MLSNAAIAGALASLYLTILILHLNPSFPLTPGAVVPLASVLLVAYGVNVTALFYALIVGRQLLASEVLSPGWLSVRLLSWLCTIAAGAAAIIMWLNLRTFTMVLDPQAVTRMTAGAVTLSASTVVFLLIALAHLDRRGGNVSAVLLTAMMAISVAAPLAARGSGRVSTLASRPTTAVLGLEPARRDARVLVVALDGGSLDVISPAVAEGRLPNFGRILDAGAVLHLATLRPTQAEPVWSAAMTGRVPFANGVRASTLYRAGDSGAPIELLPDYCLSFALVRFGFLDAQSHDARALQSRPLWTILSDVGVSVGFIGWPLTHPATNVNGFIVTDEFHRIEDVEIDPAGATTVAPASLYGAIRDAVQRPLSVDPIAVVSKAAEAPQGDADARLDPSPIVADRMHVQILTALEPLMAPQVMAVRLPGLDAVGHYFLRYANPSEFGDVSADEQRQYGRVLGDYYAFIDGVIGQVLQSMGKNDVLLVVSGFGMEPLTPGKRMLERLVGNDRLSGSHERSPDGFLLAYGTAVAPSRPPRASVLDLTPTILYYLGLPVGRDMEGFARTDLFKTEFTADQPITFIPSYGR